MGGADGEGFKERVRTASRQICRAARWGVGEGLNPHAPDFSEMLLTGYFDSDQVVWVHTLIPPHDMNQGNIGSILYHASVTQI